MVAKNIPVTHKSVNVDAKGAWRFSPRSGSKRHGAEWDKIKNSNDQAIWQSFIAGYPNSPLTPLAQSRLESLQHVAKKQEEKARAEWNEIKGSNHQTALQSFIAHYPNSPFAQCAKPFCRPFSYAPHRSN